jgi:glycosyltransferase involved in cell wall biosynthesis
MEASELVCLSFHETFLSSGPLVLLDAMAAGKAIVATECNATRDYLTHRLNGMLFKPNDHVALRSELVALHDDMQLRQHLGKNARQTIIDEHMPQQFYNSLLNILDLA